MGANLKPCRSPYCECDHGKCTHPGFYDARSEVVKITDPAQRRAKVMQAIDLFKKTLPQAQRMGQLVLRMAVHSDAKPEELMAATVSYGNAIRGLQQTKQQLLDVARKERISYVVIHALEQMKVTP